MSKIEETLGLRSLEEAMRDLEGLGPDTDDEYDPYQLPAEFSASLDIQIDEGARASLGEQMLAGRDAEERLDAMHDKLMDHAETLANLAMELDPGKAPRAFEVMNAIVKNAMDAVNSKRDHQLKTLRLILDQQKFEHDRNANDGVTGQQGDAVVAVMTTADLVRSFRKELDNAPVTEARTTPTDK